MTAVAPLPALQSISNSTWNGTNGISTNSHQPSSAPVKNAPSKRASQRPASAAAGALSKSQPPGPNGVGYSQDEHARVKRTKSHTSLKPEPVGTINSKLSSLGPLGRSVSRPDGSDPSFLHRSDNSLPNGSKTSPPPPEPPILALKSTNNTFEPQTIQVPYYPNCIRIGRLQLNQKNANPAQLFFDSKVLSRSHAEIWADQTGRVFIKDLKSSNGTFLNEQRLSPEGKESEPFPLHEKDHLELGIDIYTEDQKQVVHRKIAAKVQYVGFPKVVPYHNGDKPQTGPCSRQRSPSQGSTVSSTGTITGPDSGSGAHLQHAKSPFLTPPPVSIDDIGKLITADTLRAKQDSVDILRIRSQLSTIIHARSSRRLRDTDHQHPGLDQPPNRLGRRPRPGSSNGSSANSDLGQGSFSSQSSPEMEHKSLGSDPHISSHLPPVPLPGPVEPPMPLDCLPLIRSPDDSFGDGYLKYIQELPSETTSVLKDMGLHVQPSIPRLVEALSRTKIQLDSHAQQVSTLEALLNDEKQRSDSLERQSRELRAKAAAYTFTGDQPSALSPPSSRLFNNPPSEATDAKLKAMEERIVSINTELSRTKSLLDEYKRRAEQAEEQNHRYLTELDQAKQQALPSPESLPSPQPESYPDPPDSKITNFDDIDEDSFVDSEGLSQGMTSALQSFTLPRSSLLLHGLRSRSSSFSRESSILLARPMASSPTSAIFGSLPSTTTAGWLLQRAGICNGQFVTSEHIQKLEADLASLVDETRKAKAQPVEPTGPAGQVPSTATATIVRSLLDERTVGATLPYTSLVGVVIVGVGLMAWLNGWQKSR